MNKCPECKAKLEIKDYCRECDQQLRETELECPKCCMTFNKDGEEI